MPQHFSLYAIYALETYSDSGAFDKMRLPLEITDDVRIEHVEPLLKEDTFKFVTTTMGTDAVENLERVKYALVHRFDPDANYRCGGIEGREKRKADSEMLVRSVAACLRLIRPMRQFALSMQGTVRPDGTFDVLGFDSPIDLLETPENQKLFRLRNRDADDLIKHAPLFLEAMNRGIWKFKMAAQFHELGHFQDQDWKARYMLWSSAIESIYTSHNPDHKGSNVAKERIKWFLGKSTSIYPLGDLADSIIDPKITVGGIVDDLYEVRNYLAHGDRIPNRFFQEWPRTGVNGPLRMIVILFEAQSFIIRHSMLKMLRDGLTAHFAGAAESEAYFGANGLTNSQLKKKKKAGVP